MAQDVGTTLVELCHAMSRPALYVWTVSITGVAVIVVSGLQVIWFPLPFSWLALAGLALLSGLTVLRLPFSASFSVGDAFSFARVVSVWHRGSDLDSGVGRAGDLPASQASARCALSSTSPRPA